MPKTPRELGWQGADARHNMSLPPEVRNSRANELWDHYSVGSDLGPFMGPLLGLAQETIGRPVLSRYPDLANNLAPSVFNFRTPTNDRPGAIDPYPIPKPGEGAANLRAILSGAFGMDPNLAPPTTGQPDPTGHTFTPGDIDPATGQPLNIQFGIGDIDPTPAAPVPDVMPIRSDPRLGNKGPTMPTSPTGGPDPTQTGPDDYRGGSAGSAPLFGSDGGQPTDSDPFAQALPFGSVKPDNSGAVNALLGGKPTPPKPQGAGGNPVGAFANSGNNQDAFLHGADPKDNRNFGNGPNWHEGIMGVYGGI